MKIAHEGFPTITIVGVFTAVALMLSWSYLPLVISVSLSSILLSVWFLSIYFFRDPERTLPINLSEEVLLSPADGKVVVVKEVESVEYLEQEAVQISIFLSPLNVYSLFVTLASSASFLRAIRRFSI